MGAPTYQTDEAIYGICDGAFTDDVSGKLTKKVASEFPYDIWTDARDADSPDELDWQWEFFAQTVQSRSRFIIVAGDDMAGRSRVPPGPAAFLGRLAAYVDGQLDLMDDLEPGAVFYRGRLMDDPMALERECTILQPPPSERAAANRMSPAGIPMFYASADPQTAIAELAGHGPQPYALVGAFRSTTRLRRRRSTSPVHRRSRATSMRQCTQNLAGAVPQVVRLRDHTASDSRRTPAHRVHTHPGPHGVPPVDAREPDRRHRSAKRERREDVRAVLRQRIVRRRGPGPTGSTRVVSHYPRSRSSTNLHAGQGRCSRLSGETPLRRRAVLLERHGLGQRVRLPVERLEHEVWHRSECFLQRVLQQRRHLGSIEIEQLGPSARLVPGK